jgi:hypothetical protein
MNFVGVRKGDKLYIKLAFTIYTIIDITVEVEAVTNDEIVAKWDDIEDMRQCTLIFDRQTGIAKRLPKKYNKAACWIMRYVGELRSDLR